jgi:hypothetical protein
MTNVLFFHSFKNAYVEFRSLASLSKTFNYAFQKVSEKANL